MFPLYINPKSNKKRTQQRPQNNVKPVERVNNYPFSLVKRERQQYNINETRKESKRWRPGQIRAHVWERWR